MLILNNFINFFYFNIFQFSKADDIRDFQIEGMSLYESALDYFQNQK